MVKKSKKLRHFRHPKVLWPLVGVLVVLLIAGSYAYYRHHKSASEKVIIKAGNLSDNVRKNVSAGANIPKNSGNSASSSSGAIVDTHGQATADTNPNDWIKSSSGEITVKQPTANAKLQNEDTLSGSASTDTVCYRLIDNTSGVLATGSLSVNSSNFSGRLQFSPNSSSGRLDVYSSDSDCLNGVELNLIEIAVNF